MNKQISSQTKGKHSWFGFVATALAILLLILIGAAMRLSMPQTYDYHSEPTSILSNLRSGRYSEAVMETAENRAMGYDERSNPDYASPYAACDYFEAYSYYLAYQRTGDGAKAAEYESKMQECYDKMGALQFMAEEMRQALDRK